MYNRLFPIEVAQSEQIRRRMVIAEELLQELAFAHQKTHSVEVGVSCSFPNATNFHTDVSAFEVRRSQRWMFSFSRRITIARIAETSITDPNLHCFVITVLSKNLEDEVRRFFKEFHPRRNYTIYTRHQTTT